ncbi:MAG: diadenylate cyclase [Bacteroidota bacterium]
MTMNEESPYIWRWEKFFLGSAGIRAQSLFKQLDPDLDPQVYVIGIRANPRKGKLKAIVLPYECEQLPDSFLNFLNQQDNDTRQHPIEHRVIGALQEIDKQGDRLSFVSTSIAVSDLGSSYDVLVVLRLKESTCSVYPSLKQNRVRIHRDATAEISTSLIDATAREFLEGCVRILRLREPGAGLGVLELNSEELLRSAGNRLMTVPEWKGADLSLVGILYHACVGVAMMRYEGSETRGYVILSHSNHTHIEFIIRFAEPIRLYNRKVFRKLLESTSSKHSLIADAEHIHGFGHAALSYDQNEETLFEIRFDAGGIWRLMHAGSTLMRVRYGQPELPTPKVSLVTINKSIRSIDPEISEEKIVLLRELIVDLSEIGHGALLVISCNAADEAIRLQGQAFRTDPFILNRDMLAVTTAIDGAVLIGVDRKCHAFGVILDGIAVKEGDQGRGARYNSAVRYLNSTLGKAVAIIVSEDGYVDVLPPLKR